MLQSLYIRNYALIDMLDIGFYPGFSVITGETGAGKSIILGAISLLLGQRADSKSIKIGAEKCVVEAKFNTPSSLKSFFVEQDLEYDAKECILRREVYSSGKSRAFINDTPASLSQMKVLGEQLIDIHSQHKNLLLSHEGFQREVLDIVSHDEEELNAYIQLYKEYKQISQKLNEFVEFATKHKQEEDYLRFQLQQIEELHLESGEQERLQQESDLLSHSEEIKSSLYEVEQRIASDEGGLIEILRESIQALDSITNLYSPSQEWMERLESCRIELDDLQREINHAQENVEFNPTRLDYVNERLNQIYSLEQKHRVKSVEELISLADNYREQLNVITSSDDEIEELEKQKATFYEKVLLQAKLLRNKRIRASKEVEKQMVAFLVPLGMPNIRFAVEIQPLDEPTANGMDSIKFLFSANKNTPMQQVVSVASGGEIARVMLALKALVAGTVNLPTIIFDEIDTGVSGAVAEKMGKIMQDMGNHDRQVISITHLPQIAAKGSVHYKVYKEDNEMETNTRISCLSTEERVHEIANMLSGEKVTEEALNNARVLLDIRI